MQRREFLGAVSGAAVLAGFTPWQASAQSGRQPIGYLRTNWSRDRYSFGSYSFVPNGARQSDRSLVEEPVDGRLYFAGEAVHPTYNSTVHAAYLSGRRSAQLMLDDGHESVVIVGAGMSGLAAAQLLTQNGVRVQVVEARGRIGGRIWSNSELGFPVDLGASWIHGTRGNPLTRLADQAGAKRVRTNYDSFAGRGSDGRRIRFFQMPGWWNEVAEVQQSIGASSDEVNFDSYDEQEEFGGSDVSFPGGYVQLFGALASRVRLVFNATVSRINYESAGASATSNVGVFRGDAVLVTVPLGVLKAGSIDFSPALPSDKRAAISRLQMGLLDKLFLQYDEVFWDREEWIGTPETGLPQGQFNQWLNLDKLFGVPVIMAFNGAQPAKDLARLRDDSIVERAVSVLSGAYPQ